MQNLLDPNHSILQNEMKYLNKLTISDVYFLQGINHSRILLSPATQTVSHRINLLNVPASEYFVYSQKVP